MGTVYVRTDRTDYITQRAFDSQRNDRTSYLRQMLYRGGTKTEIFLSDTHLLSTTSVQVMARTLRKVRACMKKVQGIIFLPHNLELLP